MVDFIEKLASGLALPWAGTADAALAWPTFAQPQWLLLITPLWAASWWIARRSLAFSGVLRRWIHLGTRLAVIALLAIVLAEPHVRWRADDVAVVAVLDVSDSVPSGQHKLADEFLSASLAKRSAQDRFGLVTVARDALVQALPTTIAPGTDIGTRSSADASDLRSGIDLARALIPSDAAGRILLISDGNETSGSIAAAADGLASLGIPIDVAAVDYDRSSMVSIKNLIVPAWAREGDVVNVRVMMEAGRPHSGRLTLLLNDNPIDLEPDLPNLSMGVDLVPGVQVVTAPITLPPGPVHRFEAVFEPNDRAAAVPQLLRAEAVTFTSSQGRVLVLAEDAEAAAPFTAALSRGGLRAETRPAVEAPRSLTEWSGFDAVVLFDQPSSNFSEAQQEDLVRYVHDTGGGLLAVGGPDSFGAGGWIGSRVADILPVQLDPPQKRQMPKGALCLIIDRSGSMGSQVTGTGLNQQQIANEAAILGVRALSRLDQLVVIAFDSSPTLVVPLTHVGEPERIVRQIRTVAPGGGTNLFPALELAGVELNKSDAGIRHVIVLTDGQTQGDPQHGLTVAAALKRRGITVSTVAIGDGSNDPLLTQLAQSAGGRFYTVRSEDSRAVLPQIFIKEAKTVRRSLIWEGEPFTPKIGVAADAMSQISGPVPGISGYVVTADRGGLSTVALRGPENDPILAQWQHGLGRVTAYTSDAAARWNARWIPWNAYDTFWEQQVKWVMRPGGDARARVNVDEADGRASVTFELFDARGNRVSFAAVRGRLTSPATNADGSRLGQDVDFQQLGPGRYEARVDAQAVGTHLLSIRYDAGPGEGSDNPIRGVARAAIVRRGGEEFREPTPATAKLWDIARKTNGRIYRMDAAGANLWVRDHLAMPEISRSVWLIVAVATVLVFLIDVAVRRVAISVEAISARVAAMLGRGPEVSVPSFATLAAAKARAGVNTARHAAPVTSDRPIASPIQSARRPDAGRIDASDESAPALSMPPPASPASPTGGVEAGYMDRLRASKSRSTQHRPPAPPSPPGDA